MVIGFDHISLKRDLNDVGSFFQFQRLLRGSTI